MKLAVYFLTIFMTFSSFVSAEVTKPNATKIYVTQNDVQVAENGIHVNLQDGTAVVKNLRSDNQGLYIFEKDILLIAKGKYGVYYCRQCRKFIRACHQLRKMSDFYGFFHWF